MLMRDKTASSIKRKVQTAKQKVDKDAREATKLLANVVAYVTDLDEQVRLLDTELSDARFAQEDAEKDSTLATKAMAIASDKQAAVLILIAKFERELEELL